MLPRVADVTARYSLFSVTFFQFATLFLSAVRLDRYTLCQVLVCVLAF
jgi:hypothetical protein